MAQTKHQVIGTIVVLNGEVGTSLASQKESTVTRLISRGKIVFLRSKTAQNGSVCKISKYWTSGAGNMNPNAGH